MCCLVLGYKDKLELFVIFLFFISLENGGGGRGSGGERCFSWLYL